MSELRMKRILIMIAVIMQSVVSLAQKHKTQSDTISSFIRYDDTLVETSDTMSQHSDSSNLIQDYLLRKDSLDVYTYSFFKDSINYLHLEYIDTTNHHSENYNPVKYFNVAYNDLGVSGSAQKSQIFSPSVQTGFDIGIQAYNVYFWKPKDIKLYDLQTPYTKVFYLMGGQKEQSLKATHSQSFLNKQVSIDLDFQLFNHIGAYKHQKTNVNSVYLGTQYRTKNSRYSVNVQYYRNKQNLEENGGIVNLSDFENNIETNREVITTNLTTGENEIQLQGFAVKQCFYLSKPEPDFSKIPDTNTIAYGAYSVTHFKKPYFDPVSHLGQFKYYFNYEKTSYKYFDKEQKSKIYEGIPYYPTFDSTILFDSIGMNSYQHELIYSNSDYQDDVNHPKFLNYFFGARQEHNSYYQDSVNISFDHYALIGGVFINLSKYLSVLSEASYYVGDYMNNDMSLNAKVFFKLKKNVLDGGIQINHRSAAWKFQNFSSSRFTWHNQFDKTDIQKMHIKFRRDMFSASAQVLNISNYVFFNDEIVPEQYIGNIQHIMLQVSEYLMIGHHWGGDISLTYQKVSETKYIRMPELTGRMKVYYRNIFFNKALDFEMGVEVFYFTEYYADKYMPAIRSFHIQNDQKIGGYPFIDVYANAKIGKARLFVRYDHLNAGLMEYRYYASPDYPTQDASFKFGVSWILFN